MCFVLQLSHKKDTWFILLCFFLQIKFQGANLASIFQCFAKHYNQSLCFIELNVKYLFSDGLGVFGKIHLPRRDFCFKVDQKNPNSLDCQG